MKNKIKKARKILGGLRESKLNDSEMALLMRLKDMTDLAELTYNDVKIKRLKSKAAEQSMNKLENELDKLISEAKTKNIR